MTSPGARPHLARQVRQGVGEEGSEARVLLVELKQLAAELLLKIVGDQVATSDGWLPPVGVANPSGCTSVSDGSSSTEAMLKARLASLDAG